MLQDETRQMEVSNSTTIAAQTSIEEPSSSASMHNSVPMGGDVSGSSEVVETNATEVLKSNLESIVTITEEIIAANMETSTHPPSKSTTSTPIRKKRPIPSYPLFKIVQNGIQQFI